VPSNAGERFVVTRNGVPVAELRPIQRRRFIATETLYRTAAPLAPLNAELFLSDLDRHFDQQLRHG